LAIEEIHTDDIRQCPNVRALQLISRKSSESNLDYHHHSF